MMHDYKGGYWRGMEFLIEPSARYVIHSYSVLNILLEMWTPVLPIYYLNLTRDVLYPII